MSLFNNASAGSAQPAAGSTGGSGILSIQNCTYQPTFQGLFSNLGGGAANTTNAASGSLFSNQGKPATGATQAPASKNISNNVSTISIAKVLEAFLRIPIQAHPLKFSHKPVQEHLDSSQTQEHQHLHSQQLEQLELVEAAYFRVWAKALHPL